MRASCTYTSSDKKAPVETAQFVAAASSEFKNGALYLENQIHEKLYTSQDIQNAERFLDDGDIITSAYTFMCHLIFSVGRGRRSGEIRRLHIRDSQQTYNYGKRRHFRVWIL